jgi:ubiquinone/menaquinone biosynthesis C-methylase UbiE
MEQERRFPSEIRKFNPSNVGEHAEDVVCIGYDTIQIFLENLGVDIKKAKILEVGPGKGKLLGEMIANGVDVVGVDIRPRGAVKNRIVGARIEQLPFADGTFDVVISLATFDNDMYDQDQVMMAKEMARVLKSGGVLQTFGEYIEVPTPGLIHIGDEDAINSAYKKI